MMINSVEEIELFLKEVDKDFPIPLSEKVDICEYAAKLYEKATLCIKRDEISEKIIALAAGYTEELSDNIAYLSILAVSKEHRNRGLGRSLVQEFLNICRNKRIDALHLYCVESNISAMKTYENLGFQKYYLENETRKKDVHFICYLK